MNKLIVNFKGLKWYLKVVIILVPLFYIIGMFSDKKPTNYNCNCEYKDQIGRTKRTRIEKGMCTDLMNGTWLGDDANCDVPE